jgi:hypothetical protein
MRWVYESLRVNRERFICSILPSPCISLQPESCSSEHPFSSDEVNTEREGAMERGSLLYVCRANFSLDLLSSQYITASASQHSEHCYCIGEVFH